MIPKIKIAPLESYDDRGHLEALDHQDEWTVDFTATFAKELRRPKIRLIWFFERLGPAQNKWGRIKDRLISQAMKSNIVFIYIHKVFKPKTAEEKALVVECNRHFKAEREELAMVNS